jgi:hypothetical protein
MVAGQPDFAPAKGHPFIVTAARAIFLITIPAPIVAAISPSVAIMAAVHRIAKYLHNSATFEVWP